jgi:hypothetical protein
MKLLKVAGFILLLLFFGSVLLFVIASKFSSVKSKYECNGILTSGGESNQKTVYIIHEKYRWWVDLWSNSKGNLKLEIPNIAFRYYGHIQKIGYNYMIYYQPNELVGSFSSLSKTLSIDTQFGFFDGKCKNID